MNRLSKILNINTSIIKNYFLVFFMILSFSPVIKLFELYFISILFMLVHIKEIKKIRKIKSLKYLIIVILMFLTTIFTEIFINKGEVSLAIGIYLANFFIGYLFSVILDWKYFSKYYIKIMMYLSFFSLLVFYLIIYYPEIIEYNYSIMLNYGNSDVIRKSILVYNFIIKNTGEILKRNTGPAWEPGAFQFLVNLALALAIKQEKKLITVTKIIFIITVLTTKSTTGIITLGFLVIYLVKNKIREKIIRIFPLIVIFILAIKKGLENNFFKYHIFEKLNSNNQSGGFSVREEAFSNVWEHLINSPILGVGSRVFLEKGDTYDSYSLILGMYGMIFFIYYFCILIYNYRKNMLILIVILMGFTNEVIWHRLLLTYLFFVENKE